MSLKLCSTASTSYLTCTVIVGCSQAAGILTDMFSHDLTGACLVNPHLATAALLGQPPVCAKSDQFQGGWQTKRAESRGKHEAAPHSKVGPSGSHPQTKSIAASSSSRMLRWSRLVALGSVAGLPCLSASSRHFVPWRTHRKDFHYHCCHTS